MTKHKFLSFILLILISWVVSVPTVAARENKKQLVIINSYNEVAPWPRKYINSIIQEVSQHPDFNAARVVHLNNSLIYTLDDYYELEDMFFDSFVDNPPDYLVLIGNFAFNFRERIKQTWGDIPMLLIGQNDKIAPLEFYLTSISSDDDIVPPKMTPLESFRDEYNFSFILTPTKTRETVDMMVSMFPNMKKLVFMADGLYVNRHLSHVIKEYLELKYPNMEYEWLFAGEEGVMLPYLNDDDPNVGLLLSTWYYTAPGVSGLPLMSATDSFLINGAHKPVFGLRYAYMGYGILGGYFVSPEEIHQNVLAGVADLIGNKNMRDVPFRLTTEGEPYISYPKLLSLELPESICPPDTVFLDKPKTFWELYKFYVFIGGAVFIALITILMIWLIAKNKIRIRKDYNSLVNSMPIGYMQAEVDLDREGTIKSVHYVGQNEALKSIINDHNLKSINPEDFGTTWQDTADSIFDDNGTKSSIIKVPDDDVYIEFIVNPDKKSNENRLLLDVFAIDVTDKMKVEHVLREAAKKAVEADNMKSAFLANMSHEIRTPLNAIVGFSNLLCKAVDPEKKKRFIEIIETNNKLLLKLIGDILDISKADSDKLVFNKYNIDINKLLTTVCTGVDVTSKPDVKINIKLGMDKCFITSDPYRITQVLNNLLTNAIKFTDSGTILVGYELVQNNMLRFYVKDPGQGIAPADMPKLFTRFTKLNSFIQGTGLGLSISKAIVEKLGGSMRAESQGRGNGSTFYFTVPYVLDESKDSYNQEYSSNDEARLEALKKKNLANANQDPLRSSDHNSLVDPSMPSYKYERKKILVVEDNESNSELIKEMLEDRFDLVFAKDGEQSMTVFAKETPGIVLMDINLPVKDGYQATTDIRRLSKTVPIIAVTAYAQQSDRQKAMTSGFTDYLAKPVEEEDLIATIRRYL